MKTILCLIDGLGFGGAQRQLIGLVDLLNHKGYKVDIACYHERHFYDQLLSDLKIEPIVLPAKGPIGKILAVKKLIQNNKYDTVITYLQGPNSIACILKAFRMNFRLLLSERITNQNIDKKAFFRFQLYRFADIIIPNSYSQKNFIDDNFRFLSGKTRTITNFTDTEYFIPNSKYYPSECKQILVAGRIHTQKNIFRFIEALSLLKNKNIRVKVDWYGDVGYGMESYNNEVQKKYTDSDIKELITFHPGSKKILELYRQCDAFCLPSLYEGFPNVVCEAMSCGKPILCSDVCDNPHLVRDGENGFLFNPKSSEDMAAAIMKFCDLDTEEIIRMGECSRNRIIELCSTETFVQKYIKLIEE